jgi:bifunctional DNA-binding transcriptional regulator/antitoxin component of YhaV-PrlF toxin-antitoxin module
MTMTRRKTEASHIRSLTKVSGGTSYSVTIPIEYIRKMKWRAKQKLEVKLYQDRIIIRDWKG